MEQKIEKISCGIAENGKEAYLVRIPNSTNNYIEFSTDGCVLKRICLHTPDGSVENILAEAPPEFGGLLHAEEAGCPAVPAGMIWDVAETGENHVLLTCRADGRNGGIMLGTRIMWVNLNRLVVDLFVTPEKDALLDIRGGLLLRTAERENCMLRTFCPRYRQGGDWRLTEGSLYGALRFQPLISDVAFAAPEGEEVRPMAEVAGTAKYLAVSIYGNLPETRFLPLESGVQIVQALAKPIGLRGGETCAGRVIYGFDYFSFEDENEPMEAPASPFGDFV